MGRTATSDQTASITTHFVGQNENAELREIKERMVRMEQLLEQMAARPNAKAIQ